MGRRETKLCLLISGSATKEQRYQFERVRVSALQKS
jgi:hypothetical protein